MKRPYAAFGKLEPHVFGYLDGIIIATPTFERHLEILEDAFQHLSSANLRINCNKC